MFGVGSAMCFAAGSIMFKQGQKRRPGETGMFGSVVVNVAVLGLVATSIDWPVWNLSGVVGLVVGGLLGTGAGRFSSLQAIRRIGPSRADAFLTANPVVAAVVGWVVLGERLGWFDVIGGAITVAGLVWLVSERREGAPPSGGGYLWAMAAPLSFGMAFVARKWGMERYPSAVVGALIGASTMLVVLSAVEARRSRLTSSWRELSHSPWFLGAGVATSVALLSHYQAFAYLPAWLVGLLQGTQSLFTVAFGWLFLRQEEAVNRRLVVAVVTVVSGIVVIAAG